MKKHTNSRSLSMIGTLLLGGVVLTACSDNDDDNDLQPLADDTRAALITAELTGTWSTGCIVDDVNDVSDGYEVQTVSFASQEFTASAASFSDAGCTTAVADDDDVDLQGTYTLGGAVTTTDGQPATTIDFTYTDTVSGQQSILLDLVSIQNGSLFLGEGDFDELLENDVDSRPVLLDLLEPYFVQP